MRTHYLKRLVGRVTCARQDLNDNFSYYGHRVVLQSCMRGFVVVMVYAADTQDSQMVTEFDFDFYTKKLTFDYSNDIQVTCAIVEAFDEIYSKVNVKYPMPRI